MSTLLSPHFSLEEMIRSNKAVQKGIDNTPPERSRANLVKLCREILEPIRQKYGMPIRVNSGYRCPALNKLVGGAATSQHVTGEAADIDVGADNLRLWRVITGLIKEGRIIVGQCIWEKGTDKCPDWIHVSLPFVSRPNNQILYLGVKKTK